MKPKLDLKKQACTVPTRDTVLKSIRTAIRAQDGKPLGFRKFLSISKLGPYDILCHFRKWSLALEAAGGTFKPHNLPVDTAQILEDWAGVARQMGRIPSAFEYKVRGKYGLTTISKRFGAWSDLPDAFRKFASREPKWKDIVALLPAEGASVNPRRRRTRLHTSAAPPRGQRRPARLTGRPICGAPLDFAGLRHAPANELGVVFLFGAMAKDLGFLVDSLQVEFPDCHAKRLIAPDTWQPVRIEFEYRSRNFRDHGHDPDACDLIVCWEHNWPECPERIEVIALSGHILPTLSLIPFQQSAT